MFHTQEVHILEYCIQKSVTSSCLSTSHTQLILIIKLTYPNILTCLYAIGINK